ncbi:hypothetical protein GOD64_17715 [Sinorhizobium medicae]|nr:hypothetical protein [Sinorhizobium medicae]
MKSLIPAPIHRTFPSVKRFGPAVSSGQCTSRRIRSPASRSSATSKRRHAERLEIAIRAAGGSLANVVQMQVFLTERADAPGMNRTYTEFFREPYPVRATVVVKELITPGLRIEVLAHAVLDSA